MADESLLYQVEEYGMQLAGAVPDLAALPMFHRNSEGMAKANSLVFKATEREEQIQGFKSGELEIEFRAPASKTTEAQMEAVIMAIENTFSRANSNVFVDDGRTSEQENTANLYKHIRRVPFIAKLA